MKFRKMVMIILYVRQQKWHRCIEVFWILWERVRVGWFARMALKHVILSYVKRIASPGLMHDTGCSGLVHWDDPEGWYGEGGSEWGTRVYPWQIHVEVW